jgi:hypothetical protein
MEQRVYKEFVRNWKVEGGRQEQKAESRKQRTKHKNQQFSVLFLLVEYSFFTRACRAES